MGEASLDAVELAFLSYRDAWIGLRAAVSAARADGHSDVVIADRLGLPVLVVRDWLAGDAAPPRAECAP